MDREPHLKTNGTATLAAALLLAATTQLHAGNIPPRPAYLQAAADTGDELTRTSLTGRFSRYDAATGRIWIDDFVYQLSSDHRVIGSSTKLGLLSAIQYLETVEFKTAPNPKQPSIPYIVEIRRK